MANWPLACSCAGTGVMVNQIVEDILSCDRWSAGIRMRGMLRGHLLIMHDSVIRKLAAGKQYAETATSPETAFIDSCDSGRPASGFHGLERCKFSFHRSR